MREKDWLAGRESEGGRRIENGMRSTGKQNLRSILPRCCVLNFVPRKWINLPFSLNHPTCCSSLLLLLSRSSFAFSLWVFLTSNVFHPSFLTLAQILSTTRFFFNLLMFFLLLPLKNETSLCTYHYTLTLSLISHVFLRKFSERWVYGFYLR